MENALCLCQSAFGNFVLYVVIAFAARLTILRMPTGKLQYLVSVTQTSKAKLKVADSWAKPSEEFCIFLVHQALWFGDSQTEMKVGNTISVSTVAVVEQLGGGSRIFLRREGTTKDWRSWLVTQAVSPEGVQYQWYFLSFHSILHFKYVKLHVINNY